MFAAGVNQNVFHGFSYADDAGSRAGPASRAFTPATTTLAGYGESWGPRQPTWKHASDVSGYFARNQLRDADRPQRQLDAAVLVQTGYVAAGYGAPFFTPDTREARAGAQGRRHAGRLDERDDQRVDPGPPERGRPQRPPGARTARTSRRSWSRATSPSAAAILLRVATAREAARVGQGRPADRARRQLERAERSRAWPSRARTTHAQGGLIDRAAGAADGPQRRRPRPASRRRWPALNVQRDVEYPVGAVADRPPRRRRDGLLLHRQHARRRRRRASTRRSR